MGSDYKTIFVSVIITIAGLIITWFAEILQSLYSKTIASIILLGILIIFLISYWWVGRSNKSKQAIILLGDIDEYNSTFTPLNARIGCISYPKFGVNWEVCLSFKYGHHLINLENIRIDVNQPLCPKHEIPLKTASNDTYANYWACSKCKRKYKRPKEWKGKEKQVVRDEFAVEMRDNFPHFEKMIEDHLYNK